MDKELVKGNLPGGYTRRFEGKVDKTMRLQLGNPVPSDRR